MKLFDLFATLTLDSGGFEKGLSDAQKRVKAFSENIKAGVQTAMKIGAAVAAAGAAVGGYVLKTGIGYNQQMDDYTANMQTLLGGVDKAEAKIKELSDMAAKTPFELPTLVDSTQTLLAFGVKAEDSTGILKSLGDISLGNASKLETLTRAYGKMSSTGKVTLENVQMMIDAGFNPLNLIAERNHMTMESLYKAISDGKVPFEELTWAIQKATSEGGQYFNGMETASKTLTGRLSTLKENWSAFLALLTKPAYETLRDTVLPSAIDMVDKLTASFNESGLQGVLDTFSAEVDKLGKSIASKITEYFDSDQAKTDLQNATGKIVKLLTGGNIVLSDVTSFITNILSKIDETFADDTVKANLANTGEQLIKGIMTFEAGKIKTIISGLSIINNIANGLLQGVSDYFNGEDGQAATDFATILNAIADGIGKASIATDKLIQIATSIINGITNSITTDTAINSIKSIVVAIGNAIIKLGVAAIKALPSIVSAAVQIASGLVDAISAALPELGASIIDGFVALFSTDKQTELTQKLSATGKAVKNLMSEVTAAQIKYNTSISSIESRAELAKGYLETIEALESKDQLSDSEYESWKNAVDALTRMYPELSSKISAETGLFTENAQAVRDTISALNDLAATKAMSDILSGLEASAAGFVSTMVEANALLSDVSAKAAENQSQLDYFNKNFKTEGDTQAVNYIEKYGLETLTATQTKFLEQTEAGKTLLQDFYQVGIDGVATLSQDFADQQAVAAGIQGILDDIEAQLTAKQTELEAAKTETQAQIDTAQAQLDALSAKKDTLMESYKELFINVQENAATAGTTAETLGTLYTDAGDKANAAKLDINGLIDAWNNVPKKVKTEYTITGLPSTDNPLIRPLGLKGFTKHATGLYSVPYDNFPALLHRNETVLTRAQADEYRKGRGGNGESKQDIYNINIQSTAESPSETAAYIKQAMRTLRFNQA